MNTNLKHTLIKLISFGPCFLNFKACVFFYCNNIIQIYIYNHMHDLQFKKKKGLDYSVFKLWTTIQHLSCYN
jgi:hypothetical protein